VGAEAPMLLDALNIPVTANKIAKILAAFDLKNFIFDRVIFAFSQRFASKGNFVVLRVDQSEHFKSPSGGTPCPPDLYCIPPNSCQTKKCTTMIKK
jgi:hypothetical protein